MRLTEEALRSGAAQAAKIFDRIEQDAPMPFSPRFERRMFRMIRIWNAPRKVGRRIVAACLFAVLGFFMTGGGQAALTVALQRITTVQEDSSTLQYRAVEETPNAFTPMQPTVIPKRMTLTEQYDSETLRIREYSGGKGDYLRFEQESAAGTRFRYETAEAEILTIGEDEQGLCLYDADFDQWTLIWLEGTSRLMLTGNLERDEMLTAAESVR